MDSEFRARIATMLHSNCQVSREEVFGSSDQQEKPINLPHDAETMFAGYIGPKYKPETGVVFLAINPGGGGDAYRDRIPEDEEFYPLLQFFKAAQPPDVLERFEAVNRAFESIVRGWNLWRIVEPTLESVSCRLSEVAYLNVVPYRTRQDRLPRVAAREFSWKRLIVPCLDILRPAAIVTLGKKAGNVVDTMNLGRLKHFCVPRTIGDSYVSDDAASAFKDIRAWRTAV